MNWKEQSWRNLPLSQMPCAPGTVETSKALELRENQLLLMLPGRIKTSVGERRMMRTTLTVFREHSM